MTARILAAFEGGLARFLKAERDGLAAAFTTATRITTAELQDVLRQQVRGAGLGAGLEKAWRSKAYPGGGKTSLGPAGLVYSKAKRLHAAYEGGAEVSAGDGKYLVIPQPAAIALGLDFRQQGRKGSDYSRTGIRRAKWSDIEAAAARFGRLRFVRADNRTALVFADGLTRAKQRGLRGRLTRRGRLADVNRVGKSVLLFVLVKNVRVRKLLDIAREGVRAIDRLLGRLTAASPQ